MGWPGWLPPAPLLPWLRAWEEREEGREETRCWETREPR